MNNTQPKIEALYRAPEDLPAVAATPKKASGLLFLMPSFINHRKLPPVEQALGVVFQEPHSEWRLAPTICPRNRHRRHCTPPPPPSLYLPLPPPRHRPLPPPVPRNDILHTLDVAILPLVFDASIAELQYRGHMSGLKTTTILKHRRTHVISWYFSGLSNNPIRANISNIRI